jgi:hypothetical protein
MRDSQVPAARASELAPPHRFEKPFDKRLFVKRNVSHDDSLSQSLETGLRSRPGLGRSRRGSRYHQETACRGPVDSAAPPEARQTADARPCGPAHEGIRTAGHCGPDDEGHHGSESRAHLKAYADSSFMVAVYMEQQSSPKTIAFMKGYGQALPFTPWHRLEVRNTLCLSSWQKIIDPLQAKTLHKKTTRFSRKERSSFTRRLIGQTSCARRKNRGQPITRPSGAAAPTCFMSSRHSTFGVGSS